MYLTFEQHGFGWIQSEIHFRNSRGPSVLGRHKDVVEAPHLGMRHENDLTIIHFPYNV